MIPFDPQAVWIGSAHPFDLHEVYLDFRSPSDWRLERSPKRAELLITADARYKLWINGQFVARGPARSFPQHQCVDRLDVTAYLRAGENLIAVQVYQPGYSYFAYVHRGAAGLLAQLVCDGETALVTTSRWQVRRDPSFSADVPTVSIYLSGVEKRDLHLADDWIDPAYDASGWAAARTVAPVGGYPWTDMQFRAVPLLVERELPMTLVESRLGQELRTQHSDAHLALREGWFSAAPQPFQSDSDGWYSLSLQEGQAAFWVFDLGRGYSCHGWAEVQAAGGTERLAICYSEKMQSGQVVISDPQTYCRVRMTDAFCLRPGDQRVEPFTLRGGRLLIFQITGPTSADFRVRFHAHAAEYPLEVKHTLSTSDPLLNQIITICEETLRACLLDSFLDNPWRESAQWIGDALCSGLVMLAMSEDTRLLRRLIELGAQGAYPDGVLPGVLPSEAHAYAVVDFNFQWIELLHNYREFSGDDAFVGEMWSTLVKMLDRFHQDLNADGLLISQTGRRLFLDWAPMSKNEPNAIYNLHFLLALQRASDLAQQRGAQADADRWAAWAAPLRAAVRRAFWQDGCWYDDRQRTTFSQLATALALLTKTTEPAEEAALLDALAARSLDPSDDHTPEKMVLASPYMHHRVFSALRQGGRAEAVIEIIRRRWGRWAASGHPTTWENWNVDFPDGSECHAFSAHPRYHLAGIARERGRL